MLPGHLPSVSLKWHLLEIWEWWKFQTCSLAGGSRSLGAWHAWRVCWKSAPHTWAFLALHHPSIIPCPTQDHDGRAGWPWEPSESQSQHNPFLHLSHFRNFVTAPESWHVLYLLPWRGFGDEVMARWCSAWPASLRTRILQSQAWGCA